MVPVNSILACQVWLKREKRTEQDGVSEIAVCRKKQRLTYAMAAARATTAPVVDSLGRKALVGLDMEERAQPAFRPPPTPPPWSKHFSSHHMRVLCTVHLALECVTFSGKRKKGGNDNKKWVKWQTSAEIEKIAKFNLFYFRTISGNSFLKNSGHVDIVPLKGRLHLFMA
jgi:hypothetical protein